VIQLDNATHNIPPVDLFPGKLVSLVKFGQSDHWQPDPSPHESASPAASRPQTLTYAVFSPVTLDVFLWVQIFLGWFFATLGIGGVTGAKRLNLG
jgi:hypothetical protein